MPNVYQSDKLYVQILRREMQHATVAIYNISACLVVLGKM